MMQRVVKELAKVLGLNDAIELVRRWGGRELYVPVKVHPGDPLALTLGLEAARLLVQHYGGQRLQLPAERNALLDLRNAAMMADHDAGMNYTQIGLKYGLQRQTVTHILKTIKEREAVRQKFAGRNAASSNAQSPVNV
jgi:Mor family transcriptional regulator